MTGDFSNGPIRDDREVLSRGTLASLAAQVSRSLPDGGVVASPSPLFGGRARRVSSNDWTIGLGTGGIHVAPSGADWADHDAGLDCIVNGGTFAPRDWPDRTLAAMAVPARNDHGDSLPF